VTAGDIPDHLEVDLADTDIGDTIHMSDITLPKGTRPMIMDRDFVIANIGASKTVDIDDEDEAEDTGEETTEETAEE